MGIASKCPFQTNTLEPWIKHGCHKKIICLLNYFKRKGGCYLFSEVRIHRSTSTQLMKYSTEARKGKRKRTTWTRFLAVSLQLSPKHLLFKNFFWTWGKLILTKKWNWHSTKNFCFTFKYILDLESINICLYIKLCWIISNCTKE